MMNRREFTKKLGFGSAIASFIGLGACSPKIPEKFAVGDWDMTQPPKVLGLDFYRESQIRETISFVQGNEYIRTGQYHEHTGIIELYGSRIFKSGEEAFVYTKKNHPEYLKILNRGGISNEEFKQIIDKAKKLHSNTYEIVKA